MGRSLQQLIAETPGFEDSRSALLDAAADRICELEAALAPFAAASQLIAIATPDHKKMRFGFPALYFRTARTVFQNRSATTARTAG
jgi:hypothetical protein